MVLALAIGAALIAAIVSGGSAKKLTVTDTANLGRKPAPAALVAKVTSVPTAVIDSVGLGTAQVPPPIKGGTPATGKPALLFIGAEFCPYCAAERWSIVNALARFGTFSNLAITHSSAIDTLPNTATFSFYGSHYVSSVIDFTPVEVTTNEPSGRYYKSLENPTPAQQAIWSQFDPGTGFPFMYLDGRYALISPTYDAGVLQGLTHDQIAAALADANNPVTQAVVGAANGITAEVCTLTHDQPAATCADPAVKAIESTLRK